MLSLLLNRSLYPSTTFLSVGTSTNHIPLPNSSLGVIVLNVNQKSDNTYVFLINVWVIDL
jgi:hypothetical protein